MKLKKEYTKEQVPQIAKEIIGFFSECSIFLFYGEVGAGKTTLINEIAKQIGVLQESSSPTFSLVNEYATSSGDTLYHMDLYRIKDLDEALVAGIDEYIYSGETCLIEWPQAIESLIFDEPCLAIEIRSVSPDLREIVVQGIEVEED